MKVNQCRSCGGNATRHVVIDCRYHRPTQGHFCGRCQPRTYPCCTVALQVADGVLSSVGKAPPYEPKMPGRNPFEEKAFRQGVKFARKEYEKKNEEPRLKPFVSDGVFSSSGTTIHNIRDQLVMPWWSKLVQWAPMGVVVLVLVYAGLRILRGW